MISNLKILEIEDKRCWDGWKDRDRTFTSGPNILKLSWINSIISTKVFGAMFSEKIFIEFLSSGRNNFSSLRPDHPGFIDFWSWLNHFHDGAGKFFSFAVVDAVVIVVVIVVVVVVNVAFVVVLVVVIIFIIVVVVIAIIGIVVIVVVVVFIVVAVSIIIVIVGWCSRRRSSCRRCRWY